MAKDKASAETPAAGPSGSGTNVSANNTNLSPNNAAAMVQQDLLLNGIENFELPKSLVTRISKSALPDNAKLQKDTVLALVKGSTVFINYLAATAHEIATSRQHRSVSASDVLKALELLQFGDIVPMLQEELEVYRENARSSRKSKSGGSKPKDKGKASASKATKSSAGVSIEVQTTSGDTPLTLDVDEEMTNANTDDFEESTTTTGDKKMGNGIISNGIIRIKPLIRKKDEDVPADDGGDEEEEDELLSDADDNDDDDRGAEEEVDELADDDDIVEEEEEEEGGQLEDSMQVEEDELRKDSRGLDEDELDDD